MLSRFSKLGFMLAAVVLMGAGCFSLTTDTSIQTTGPAGVFVSVDKGESWRQISTMPGVDEPTLLSGVSVFRFADDPQDPSAVYWASRNNGFFYTYDDGNTWQQAPAPLNDGFVYSVAVHPADKCTIFATNGMRVYRSTDCNRSWEEVHHEDNLEARISTLSFNPFGGQEIFMGKINGDILSSRDGGENWTVRTRLQSRIEEIAFDSAAQGVAYVATRNDGLFRSENTGATWDDLGDRFSGFTQASSYRSMHIHPTQANTLFWISTYGILRSTDRGESWQPYELITSPGSVDIFGFAVNGQNDSEMYYTTSLGGRSTFYKTADGGETWSTKKLPSGQIPGILRVHPEKGNVVYIGFTIPPR